MTTEPQYVVPPEHFEEFARNSSEQARAHEALAGSAQALANAAGGVTRTVYQEAADHHASEARQRRRDAEWRLHQAAEARAEQEAAR